MFYKALSLLLCIFGSGVHLHATQPTYLEKGMPLQKYSYNDYKIKLPVSWAPLPEQEIKKYRVEYRETNFKGYSACQTAYSKGFYTLNGAGHGVPALCLVHRLQWNPQQGPDSFVKLLINDLKAKGGGQFKILKKGSTRIASSKAKWFECTHQSYGQKFKHINYVLTKGRHLYYLNCSAPEKHFSKMKKTFKKTVKSFGIK